ncbi:MAG: efflux RND transporter periplasmic adaptor subunit [Xanthomonadales bacterium]|nr:efflux RND transporter periplasmic adaptor subunit [Xanthomonadales bacterium]
MNIILKTFLLALLLATTNLAYSAEGEDEHEHSETEEATTEDTHQDDGDDHDDHAESSEAATVSLTTKQLSLAGIKVEVLDARPMDYRVYAPGEIKANGYTSYLVSPRVDSVVLRRHVALGDHVEKGQALVSLFSESVAEAQAGYQVSSSEWRRVKKLGRKAMGDNRFISAKSAHEAAYGRLLAYGLSESAIQSLNNDAKALGEYTLTAVNSGSVQSDDFNQGQRVESGQALMELSDEKELWVKALLAPNIHLELPAGTEAEVKVGNEWFTAKVIQEAHTIDPQTRTRVVRLQVNNDSHRLHPGQFADVYFSFATSESVLAVPESALMRGSDGDWTVFVEVETGEFQTQEVELGRSLGKWREIIGLEPGSRVVMEGAFFVASQISKGDFDAHNH